MKEKVIPAKLDEDEDMAFKKWAKEEGRTKTTHASILLKRLTRARKENPDAVEELLREPKR